mgnify:CR=1 FL=1
MAGAILDQAAFCSSSTRAPGRSTLPFRLRRSFLLGEREALGLFMACGAFFTLSLPWLFPIRPSHLTLSRPVPSDFAESKLLILLLLSGPSAASNASLSMVQNAQRVGDEPSGVRTGNSPVIGPHVSSNSAFYAGAQVLFDSARLVKSTSR